MPPRRPRPILVAAILAGLAVGVGAGAPRAAGAADCVRPDPLPLPLRDVPQTRIQFERYKAAVHAYKACAGADPAVQAEYERVLRNWIELVRRWGNRNRR